MFNSNDFISDMSNDNPSVHAIKALASKVLFALSVNFFNAVFSRISTKLQELASCPDENPDYSDIELIQHINVDVTRLTKLLTGTVIAPHILLLIYPFYQKPFRSLSCFGKLHT